MLIMRKEKRPCGRRVFIKHRNRRPCGNQKGEQNGGSQCLMRTDFPSQEKPDADEHCNRNGPHKHEKTLLGIYRQTSIQATSFPHKTNSESSKLPLLGLQCDFPSIVSPPPMALLYDRNYAMIEVTLLTGTAFDRSRLASKGEALLNATELDRFARLRSRSAQETFALSRWLVHQCLSRLNLSEQDSWRLSVDDRGRPIALEQSTNSTIRYSLSHRQDAIACALSAEAAVGIDLEPWDQPILRA